MSKKETLKEQLKKAVKRRAQRTASQSTNGNTDSHFGVASPTQRVSSPVAAAVDRIVEAILAVDQDVPDLTDRHLLSALRCVQRGYPSNDPLVTLTYESILRARSNAALQARYLRDALEQLVETVRQ